MIFAERFLLYRSSTASACFGGWLETLGDSELALLALHCRALLNEGDTVHDDAGEQDALMTTLLTNELETGKTKTELEDEIPGLLEKMILALTCERCRRLGLIAISPALTMSSVDKLKISLTEKAITNFQPVDDMVDRLISVLKMSVTH